MGTPEQWKLGATFRHGPYERMIYIHILLKCRTRHCGSLRCRHAAASDAIVTAAQRSLQHMPVPDEVVVRGRPLHNSVGRTENAICIIYQASVENRCLHLLSITGRVATVEERLTPHGSIDLLACMIYFQRRQLESASVGHTADTSAGNTSGGDSGSLRTSGGDIARGGVPTEPTR